MNIQTPGAGLRLNSRKAALFSGPLAFGLILLFLHPEGMTDPARAALAVTAWVALWWITEAVEIEVTALLPLLLLPLTGAMKIGPSAHAYGNPLVFLYLAGFILAIAIERWELHRRIALHIILAIGTRSKQLVLGFMLATAVISMWISNTATALMMMPIAMAVIRQFSKTDALGKLIPTPFSQALVLGVAYAASIGGMATMIGTPPNLVFAGVVRETYGIEFSFVQWLIAALPLACILLLLTWYYLVHAGFKVGADVGIGSSEALREQLRSLGPMQPEEKRVLVVFTCTAVAWIIRGFVLQPLIPALDDTIVGLLGALALFFIPAPSQPGERLMNWKHAVKMPWGILLIFGGGLALADSFEQSGLAEWIGARFTLLQGMPYLLTLFLLITLVCLLSELASNLATATMVIPILASVAQAMDMHPYALMFPAVLAASCGYMLPVATPPNTIAFGTGLLRVRDMVRSGIAIDIISIVVISLYLYFVLPLIWKIDLFHFPEAFLK